MYANVSERRLLFVKEAAAQLCVSPVTVRRAIHAGELSALRLGARGRYRVSQAAIDAYLQPVEDEA